MFFLFAGESGYENGGMDDYQGTFPSEDEAKIAFDENEHGWGQIATIHSGELVTVWRYEEKPEPQPDGDFEDVTKWRRMDVSLVDMMEIYPGHLPPGFNSLWLDGVDVGHVTTKAWVPTVPDIEVVGWVDIQPYPTASLAVTRRTGKVKWIKNA